MVKVTDKRGEDAQLEQAVKDGIMERVEMPEAEDGSKGFEYRLTELEQLKQQNMLLKGVLVNCVAAYRTGKAYNRVIRYIEQSLIALNEAEQKGSSEVSEEQDTTADS